MKIATKDLTGAALNYAVGLAEGYELSLYGVDPSIRARVPGLGVHAPWRPTYYWNQAGPIIEREFIRTQPEAPYWEAETYSDAGERYTGIGPTLLVAAMCCYVAYKLGAEIDIPDELIK